MGFLDEIFPNTDGGGLLDFLKRNAMNQTFSSGLPSDQAQYGTAPVTTAAYQPGQIQSAPLAPPMQPPPQTAAQGSPGLSMPQQQPAFMAPPQAAPQAAAGPNFFDRLANGLQSVAQGGSLLGAVRGQPDDPRSIAQQTLRTRYQALVQAGIPQQKAMLAAIDPEGAGKTIVSDALGSDKFSFAQLPDGTVVAQDPRSGAVVPKFQGALKPEWKIVKKQDGQEVYGFVDPTKRTVTGVDGKPIDLTQSDTSDTVTGPDGKKIQIPQGVDRKEFVKRVSEANADAATGKMTESQAKSSTYAARMELAEANLKNTQNEGTGYWGRMATGLPIIGGSAATNWATPEAYQKYTQARDNFIAALLRQESGAAIGKSEYESADKQYFPQPGDTPDVIAQKAETRKVAIEQMKRAAGPGYQTPASAQAASPSALTATKTGVKWSIE